MKNHRAFTIVELLVVVAIIALLSSLLLPALDQGRAKATAAECKSNLRQVGLMIQIYLADTDAYPPFLDEDWLFYVEPDRWLKPLKYDFTVPKYVVCPEKSYWNRKWWLSSYRYNRLGTGKPNTHPSLGLHASWDFAKSALITVKESGVKTPADMIAVGCGNLLGADTNGAWDHGLSVTARQKGQWPSAVHRGGANMVFCDGHIEWARQTNWMAATEAARRRWNNDNEAHKETWAPW